MARSISDAQLGIVPGAFWAPGTESFTTGVLEAAARGRDAWVEFPRPPAWLGEFWERYRMHRYGDAPTPAPKQPPVRPALSIAAIIEQAAG